MARYERTFNRLSLPEDDLAKSLELRGFWHRAAHRWLHLLVRERDERRAEALARQREFCLRQARARMPTRNNAVLTEKDRAHLDERARELGCGKVSHAWIEYC